MNKDLEKAKECLTGHTIALVKDEEVIISDKRGISPMITLIKENKDLNGFSLADVVVGKAAAMLFVKAGIKEIYAETISEIAINYLDKKEIKVSYKNIVPYIINRAKNGMCIMEELVLNDDDEEIAYQKMKNKLEAMYGNNY